MLLITKFTLAIKTEFRKIELLLGLSFVTVTKSWELAQHPLTTENFSEAIVTFSNSIYSILISNWCGSFRVLNISYICRICPKANKKLFIANIASSRLLWTDTYLVEYMYYVISGVCLWSWKWCLTSLATPCHCWWLTHMSIRSLWKNLHFSGTRRTSLTNSPTENIQTRRLLARLRL